MEGIRINITTVFILFRHKKLSDVALSQKGKL